MHLRGIDAKPSHRECVLMPGNLGVFSNSSRYSDVNLRQQSKVEILPLAVYA